jgi:multicomponent Na+:H+ antiporter subunit B
MKYFSALLIAVLMLVLFISLQEIPLSQNLMPVSSHYVDSGVKDTGATNLVNAVLFDYRGFDTLGEVTVIFAAAAAFKMLFSHRRIFFFRYGMSPIVKTGMAVYSPFIFIFGIYVIMAGHISPGGGFQGGVILASLSILLTLVYGLWYKVRQTVLSPAISSNIESMGGMVFIFIGLAGIFSGNYFLSNLGAGFFAGIPGSMFSGGSIPLLNIASGLKVTAGLSIIFYSIAGGE